MSTLAIDILVKASGLLAVAILADLAMGRRASAAARHLLWSLAIAALLALPIAVAALPRVQIRIPVARASIAGPLVTGAGSLDAVAPSAVAGAVPVHAGEPSDSAPASGLTPAALIGPIAIVYLCGVLLLLARLALEPIALRRLTRASHAVTDPGWRELLRDAAQQLGVRRPVHLLMSARDVMPLTFGTLRPTIVLPASANAWPEERRRAVLLHELAHVGRLDCMIQRFTSFACALYWPHPGVWWAARRLRVERELACDDLVLAAGAPARDYAGHLLEIAHTFGRAPAPATALGMARARQLEHRLLAILDAARNRAALRGRGRLVFMAAAMAVVVPIVAVRAALVPSDAAGLQPPSAAAPAQTPQDLTGTWEMRPTTDPGVVQINVRTARGSHGRTVRIADIAKLTDAQAAAATSWKKGSGTASFPIVREAGTFAVDGVGRDGVWAGTWSFAPSAAFAADLQKRGIGRPTPLQQLDLAIADVGKEYLDALAAARYATPALDLLVRAAQHGVNTPYVREMAALGYRLGTLDPLIRLRDHGVDPEYVTGLAANGVSKLTADELVRTRDHGVDPEYIHGLASLGFTGLTVDALVEARDHGVDPDYIRGMQALGYTQMSLSELRRTRDHGVDPAYVGDMAALGYKGATIDQLVTMRDHGVDPQYVRKLRDRGVSNLSVEEIVRRRDRGE